MSFRTEPSGNLVLLQVHVESRIAVSVQHKRVQHAAFFVPSRLVAVILHTFCTFLMGMMPPVALWPAALLLLLLLLALLPLISTTSLSSSPDSSYYPHIIVNDITRECTVAQLLGGCFVCHHIPEGWCILTSMAVAAAATATTDTASSFSCPTEQYSTRISPSLLDFNCREVPTTGCFSDARYAGSECESFMVVDTDSRRCKSNTFAGSRIAHGATKLVIPTRKQTVFAAKMSIFLSSYLLHPTWPCVLGSTVCFVAIQRAVSQIQGLSTHCFACSSSSLGAAARDFSRGRSQTTAWRSQWLVLSFLLVYSLDQLRATPYFVNEFNDWLTVFANLCCAEGRTQMQTVEGRFLRKLIFGT